MCMRDICIYCSRNVDKKYQEILCKYCKRKAHKKCVIAKEKKLSDQKKVKH